MSRQQQLMVVLAPILVIHYNIIILEITHLIVLTEKKYSLPSIYFTQDSINNTSHTYNPYTTVSGAVTPQKLST